MLRHSGSETDNILLVLKDELKEHFVPRKHVVCTWTVEELVFKNISFQMVEQYNIDILGSCALWARNF